MLLEYGHAEIEWCGEKYRIVPSLANIATLGSPREIIEDFEYFISPSNVIYKFAIAITVLNACSSKPLPESLTGRVVFSEKSNKLMYVKPQHDLPMFNDVIAFAEHCLSHGICGRSKSNKPGSGKKISEFNAYEYMELARIHLGMTAEEAENMTMTEFVRMMEVKYPDDKADDDAITKEESENLLAWLNKKNGVH